MSNLFEVLGRYALLVNELAQRAERAEELHREWMMKWYELWGDMQEARSEARYWFRLYNKTTSGERWTMAEIADGADQEPEVFIPSFTITYPEADIAGYQVPESFEWDGTEWVPPDAVDI